MEYGEDNINSYFGRYEVSADEIGNYKIKVTAKDICGNTATETATVKVIDKSDIVPPTITITSPDNGEISCDTDIIGTITDNKQLKSYKVTRTKINDNGQNEETVVIASGSTEIIEDTIATIKLADLDADLYRYEIIAQDMSGLTSKASMLLSVNKGADRLPPQAVITGVSLDKDNHVITVTGTVTDETALDRYELTLTDENGVSTVIGEGREAVTESNIGQISTDTLTTGRYELVLNAWDASNNTCETSSAFNYTVTNENVIVNNVNTTFGCNRP